MSVTSFSRLGSANAYDNALRNLQNRQTSLSNLQENLTSGKKITSASDDPTGAAQAERAMNRIARISTDQRALEAQKNSIAAAEGTLGDITSALQNFRELVVSAGNGSHTAAERTTIAIALTGLRDQILTLANTKDSNGLPLFAALGSALKPFVGPQAAAPDYTFTSNGQVVDAKALINCFESYKVTTFETSNVKVRQYGTAAFATGTAHHVYISKTDGSTLDYTDLFSYTFAYQGGKWLILGGQHSDVPIDQKQEEAAIKAALEAETKVYHDGNTEGVRSHWHFSPQTRAAATTIDGQTLYGNSGEEMRKFFTDLKPTNQSFSNSNYNIKISSGSQTAWVTFDQTTKDTAGKTLYLSHEFRGMEKVNGVWKILALSAHHYKP